MGKVFKATKVVDSKGDEYYLLGIWTGNDLGRVRDLCAVAIHFGANAGEVGPGDIMSGRGGPAWKVAENWGDCYGDTNGAGG